MACRVQMLNASTIYVSKSENRLLERPGIDGRIILKWISR
jgi:hypothetical protein